MAVGAELALVGVEERAAPPPELPPPPPPPPVVAFIRGAIEKGHIRELPKFKDLTAEMPLIKFSLKKLLYNVL